MLNENGATVHIDEKHRLVIDFDKPSPSVIFADNPAIAADMLKAGKTCRMSMDGHAMVELIRLI